MTFLTDEERARLKAQHKAERDKRVCDRIKAVLLYDKGWTFSEIAEALLLSEDAVRHHFNEYKAWNKLKPQNGGSAEKLSFQQSKELEEHLKLYTHLYVKDIIEHVYTTYHVTYSVPGMRNWLQRHDFSYKKPSVVPANSGRSRLNLSGVIDVEDHKVMIQEDKMLNTSSTINFLQKIEESYPTKTVIHVFCDNARYYRNQAVTEYLKSSKVRLHFLPPYSPNLNPIERLWKWMKERIIYNTYYEHFEDFKLAILGFFSMLSTLSPDSILGQCFRSRVRDKFRPIGT